MITRDPWERNTIFNGIRSLVILIVIPGLTRNPVFSKGQKFSGLLFSPE